MAKVEFLGVQFDRVTIDDAVGILRAGWSAPGFRYVVTPNVDHVVRLHRTDDPEVRQAYDRADLCLCDSRILTMLAWPFGVYLPTVAGSDMIAALVRGGVPEGAAITLIGGDDETLLRLRSILNTAHIVQHQPPMQLIDDAAAMAAAVRFILDNPGDLVLVAVGSPQQELIAYRATISGEATGTAVCIGAAIDFLTGRKRRAPQVLQVLGLEWLYRLCSEPKRLWRRYLVRSPRIFIIAGRWVWRRRKGAGIGDAPRHPPLPPG